MLRQMCRRGRLEALFSDGQFQTSEMKSIANLLSPGPPKTSNNTNFQPITAVEGALMRMKTKELTQAHYILLFQYLYRHTGLPWRAVHMVPHPPDALVLPITISTLTHFKHRGHTYSTAKAHDGNSAIQFYGYDPHHCNVYTGTISQIWQIPIQNRVRVFILAALDKSLSPQEEASLPFHQYPRFNTRVVDGAPSEQLVVLEPAHIISHTVVYRRPAGTFRINRETKVICLSLNRGRY
jgi:hypothetical protein